MRNGPPLVQQELQSLPPPTSDPPTSDLRPLLPVIHLVSHTHWDREWYLPAVRFRQLLVGLVDDLLAEPPAPGGSFLLDAQTVVLDDYLAIRPDRAETLKALVKRGALEAGPWFVQADELLPGGEALVRNLLAGQRAMRAIGAEAPPVLYCPDTFGHPAALPTLALGFGCRVVIASRGYGGTRWPPGDTAWWRGPDGERVLFYHLARSGYETGAQLPADADAARARWEAIRDELMPRTMLGAVLLMNGADHHARQERLREATALLADAARPDDIRISSLRAFADDLALRASGADLAQVHGELRDSYGWMWTLQGTFATRAHQKRRNARLERLLVRDVEPWVTLSRRSPSRRALVEAAWRSLLLCHPHDTICGCSTDEVARAMDARLDEAESQADGLQTTALFDVVGHDAERARVRREDWHPVLVVRNSAARPRGGVARLRLSSFVADVKVGMHPSPVAAPPSTPATPAVAGASAVQVLSRETTHERTESPRQYPDDDLVSAADALAWLPEIPAYGVRCFDHARASGPRAVPNPASVDGQTITNGRLSVRVQDDGRVWVTDHVLGRSVTDFLTWDSATDLGDLYTPSIRGVKFVPVCENVRAVHHGPVRASLEMEWTFRSGSEQAAAKVSFSVDADARFVRVAIAGVNTASDHRLRARFATDVSRARVFADAMFGPVARWQPDVPEDEAKMEAPIRTAPLHRYVSLFGSGNGATVFSDGLAEYETDDGGGVLVTLVRAVGELSRGDLPERPGHAGWPTPTPGAQCHGSFGGEFALFLHGDRTSAVIDDIERTADDVLLPLTGATLRSALQAPAPRRGFELSGEGLAFAAAKESDNGEWIVLRCVNLTDDQQDGTWRFGRDVTEARLARLDESPVAPAIVHEDAVAFVAKPREVVTLLVR